ncbi:MAG: BlaI/MecI/CopY family transcriptional regulator [Planctomycetota bacterium]|jgi:predicted transcriptional regulator
MSRKRIDELGSLQQAVMDVIWDKGEATVGDVRAALGDRRPAYTTVLSVLQKLEKAGWLEHRAEGRAYVYSAKRSRRQEGSSALWQFIDGVFRGDPTLLFEHLIEGDRLDDTDLAALRKMIDAKRQERSNGE